MERYQIFQVAFFTLFVLSACLPVFHERPQDFSIQLDWNTGALPPQYHYAYSISIDHHGNGNFSYHPGYEDNTENDLQKEFSLATDQMDDLYAYMKENGLLRKTWETGQPLMGGKGTSIIITAEGKEYAIPSVSKLMEEDRDLVNEAIDYIGSFVSSEIWEEMETRQKSYEDMYEN